MTETTALPPLDDAAFHKIMTDVGMPNSMSLYQALKHVENWATQLADARRATPPALSSPAPAVAGWKLVPVEPTPEMIAGALPLAVSSEADRAVAASIAQKAIALIMPPDAERCSDGLMLAEQMADDYRRMLNAAPPAPVAAPPAMQTDRLPTGHVVLEQSDTLQGMVAQTVRRPDGFEYMRIVSAEEAYGDDGATPPAGEGREAPFLWCVHAIGPDDLYPVESYEAAVKLADSINDRSEAFNFGRKPDSMDYVFLRAYPALWAGSAEQHASLMVAARTKEG